jgi:hypothetical protein
VELVLVQNVWSQKINMGPRNINDPLGLVCRAGEIYPSFGWQRCLEFCEILTNPQFDEFEKIAMRHSQSSSDQKAIRTSFYTAKRSRTPWNVTIVVDKHS